jgi:hypothetical protein
VPQHSKFFASFFQERRVFFSEEKKQKTFVFMRRLDRAFPLRGVCSSACGGSAGMVKACVHRQALPKRNRTPKFDAALGWSGAWWEWR